MVLKISGWLLVNKSEYSCREPPLEGSSDRERDRERVTECEEREITDSEREQRERGDIIDL